MTTSTGYEKVLFRITGNSNSPDFKATKDSVFIVSGATSNVESWFFPTYGWYDGKSFTAEWDSTIKEATKSKDPTAIYWLEEMKARFPNVWDDMKDSYEEKPDRIKLDDYLRDNKKNLTEEEAACLMDYIDEILTKYAEALEAGDNYLTEPH